MHLEKLPKFEKEDRFQTNIVNCAMLIAFLQSMDRRPSLDELTEYYANAMSTWATQVFCRVAGKNKFTKKDIDGMKKTAALMADYLAKDYIPVYKNLLTNVNSETAYF